MQGLDKNQAYRPLSDEPYMSPQQLEYFRTRLLEWRAELSLSCTEGLQHLQEDWHHEPDITDQATYESDRSFELRTKDRERKLIHKIDEALQRIEDGTYGYCSETGEPIGFQRLEARPIATLCIEAQEQHEKIEKTHKETMTPIED